MHNGYKVNLYDDDNNDSNYEPNDARWNKGTITTTTTTTNTNTSTNTNTNSENNNECYE